MSRKILNFNRSSILPEEAESKLNNPYESKINRKIYSNLKNKNLFPLIFIITKSSESLSKNS